MAERHNHMTRDIKPRGECPACDASHEFMDRALAEAPPLSPATRAKVARILTVEVPE